TRIPVVPARPLCGIQPGVRPRHAVRPAIRRSRRIHPDVPAAAGEIRIWLRAGSGECGGEARGVFEGEGLGVGCHPRGSAMLKPNTNQYWGLLVSAIFLWGFAGSEIFDRAAVDLNGVIVRSDTGCVQPYNNRCSTVYVVKDSKGISTTYIAGPTDKALRRRLPVGTIIVKPKWRLAYTVNGVRIDDFPISFY